MTHQVFLMRINIEPTNTRAIIIIGEPERILSSPVIGAVNRNTRNNNPDKPNAFDAIFTSKLLRAIIKCIDRYRI